MVDEHAAPGGPLLLVDDEPDILESLRDWLAVTVPGLQLACAPDPATALQLVEERCPEAIVSDYRMAGMDGITFLAAARNRCQSARRLLITGYPSADIDERAAEAGIEQVMRKPLDGPRLEALASWVRAGRGPTS